MSEGEGKCHPQMTRLSSAIASYQNTPCAVHIQPCLERFMILSLGERQTTKYVLAELFHVIIGTECIAWTIGKGHAAN